MSEKMSITPSVIKNFLKWQIAVLITFVLLVLGLFVFPVSWYVICVGFFFFSIVKYLFSAYRFYFALSSSPEGGTGGAPNRRTPGPLT